MPMAATKNCARWFGANVATPPDGHHRAAPVRPHGQALRFRLRPVPALIACDHPADQAPNPAQHSITQRGLVSHSAPAAA